MHPREVIVFKLVEATRLEDGEAVIELVEELAKTGAREYPPYTRASMTRKFEVPWDHKEGVPLTTLEVYLTVGLYPDGRPCDLLFWGGKMGDFPHGILNALAQATSLALQYGTPIQKIIKQWKSTQFPPAGFTGDQEFPRCTSLLDMIGKWMESKFAVNDDWKGRRAIANH